MECKGCVNQQSSEQESIQVPYVVHESATTRLERIIKKLALIIILLILLLVGTNIAWIAYESQFETVMEETAITQDNEDGNNNYVGNDGEIIYGEAGY